MSSICYLSVTALIFVLFPAGEAGQTPSVSKSFKLGVLATTMTQIVLQWEGEPATTASFEVERATNPAFTENVKSYSLDKASFLFSDTDREPVSKNRFMGDKGGPLLDPDTTYYYRVVANLAGGGSVYSNTVGARVSGPARGEEGDLWADIVLGKPDFCTNATYRPSKYGAAFPGGVLIDKTVRPNRMYIADCNNNRILGFKSTSPKNGADIVLGQLDFLSGGGNGDSCAQLFPYRQKSSASSLCLTLPTQISMGETVVKAGMAIDEKGNLYVADVFNNRVLKYTDPFGTDTKADEVWGQADFTGNEPNRGKPTPGNNTFKFNHCTRIALGPDGSLWVADGENNRVLRFPKNKETGVIAKEADIVLGQPDFTSRGDNAFKRTLAELWYPAGVGFDSKGNLYVSDGITTQFDGRILVFEPPFKSGMAAARRMPVPIPENVLDQERQQGVIVANIVRDINPDRMWFENGQNTGASELVDLRDGKVIASVPCDQSSGIDVDSDGNLYTVNKWGGVYRYPSSSWSLPWAERQKLVEDVFVKSNIPTADSTGGILGITILNDQLIIAENSRMLIWNKWNLDMARTGQPADDLYGEEDFTAIPHLFGRYYASPQTDKSGRLWVCKREGGHTLEAYTYPLTRNSKPVKSILISGNKPNLLPVKGGGAISGAWADFFDFAVVGTGDKIWIADRNASRVFRINNVDGLEDPQSGPYVDIVLGQNNLAETGRNQGKDQILPRGLSSSYNVDVSPEGELLIADNGGEVGSARRIVIYDAKRFPDKPAKCLFADDIGDPDRVIGTGGKLDIAGYLDSVTDPMCSPFEVGITSKGAVIAGMNGYSGQRFPLVYLNPSKTTEPQMALGDFTAYPTNCFVDKDDNVYVGDWDWSRVLIYRKPFKKVRY
jgi:hypothetical protein